uniref:Uncharacterized protein n=1 Tax=Arundo donax TaxID=35708 RepID=A0A0A8YGG3_ARUDO
MLAKESSILLLNMSSTSNWVFQATLQYKQPSTQ